MSSPEPPAERPDEPSDATSDETVAMPNEPGAGDTAPAAPDDALDAEPDADPGDTTEAAADDADSGDTTEAAVAELAVEEHPRHRAHRTWPQRALLALNIVVIVVCFVGAAGLLIGRHYGNRIARVELEVAAEETVAGAPPTVSTPPETVVTDGTADTEPDVTVPPETFPDVDPEAKNFLITGADNNACIDPDSPYAAAFGNREEMGERSDTIMLMRVDPVTKLGAVLSFPRDLYVKIAGTNSNKRINSAYVKDDPQRLIDTIYQNFGLTVDHFIQIDFCAFKTIVDAVGGVAVPFEYPARDDNTGLDVPAKGCFTFDGDHALAYVRSRHYEYQDENGRWKEDPASDLGRVSRQQDFLRRVLSAALDKGIVNPDVARGLIKTAEENIVVDTGLTITRMLEFVGVLKDFEPGEIATYQIEAEGQTISGAAVLVPRIKGDNMQAILRIFKGEAPLAGAPEQVFDTTTTSAAPTTTDRDATTTTTRGSTTTTVAPVATVPGPEENVKGIVPPEDVSC